MDTLYLIIMLGGAMALGCGLGIGLAYVHVSRAQDKAAARVLAGMDYGDGLDHKGRHLVGLDVLDHTSTLGSLGPDSLEAAAMIESAQRNYDEYKRDEVALAAARAAISHDRLRAWLPWRRIAFWWRNRRKAGWPAGDDISDLDFAALDIVGRGPRGPRQDNP